MESIEGLGERLKELRTERDMTMDMVVYDINHRYNIELSKGHLSKWENGINVPSLRLAKYLCLYYSTPPCLTLINRSVERFFFCPCDILCDTFFEKY